MSTLAPVMDIHQILKQLPHRYPILLVDRVLARLGATGEEMITEVSCKFRPDAVSDELSAAGATAVDAVCDVRDAEAVQALADRVHREIGPVRLLVNNAGVLAIAPLEDFKLEDFDQTLAINVRSVFIASQEAAKHMGEGSRIVNIGSTNADRMPFGGTDCALPMLYAAEQGIEVDMKEAG